MKPVASISLLCLSLSASILFAQAQLSPPAVSAQPLPDIPTLMQNVEQTQKHAEFLQNNYLYHEVAREQRSDGRKTETREYDVFWLRGVQVHKLVRKNGKDLSADEERKENERLDKEVQRSQERKRKADAAGKETDSHGNEEVTVSRFLELGTFSNARRVKIDERDAIAVDFAGNPKASTKNRLESVIRDLTGTIWIDEQDRAIAQIQGRFADSFKVGGGLVMSIKKGTAFSMQQRKINNEVWLPSRIEGNGAARVMLLLHFDGSILITESDYRRFKATSTILPGVETVQQSNPGDGGNSTNPPDR